MYGATAQRSRTGCALEAQEDSLSQPGGAAAGTMHTRGGSSSCNGSSSMAVGAPGS